MRKGNKKRYARMLAKNIIKELFDIAESEKSEDLKRRYVEIARKVAEKVNIRIGRKYGKLFCRRCNTYFTSSTLKVRLDKRTKCVCYICKRCGYIRRYPYKKHTTH